MSQLRQRAGKEAHATTTTRNNNTNDTQTSNTNDAPPPYSLSYLALDLAPAVCWLLAYCWLWSRGGWVSRGLVLLMLSLQVFGFWKVYRMLRHEMVPRHWPKELHHATASASAAPAAAPTPAPAPSPPSLELPSATPQTRPHSYFDLVAVPSTNPFLHPTWKLKGVGERLRISGMAVTLVPFRAASTVLILLAIYVALKLALLGVSTQAAVSKPLSNWRSALLAHIVHAGSCVLLFAGFGFCAGLTVEFVDSRTNKGKDQPYAPIVIANHTSFVDPVLLYGQGIFASAVGAIDNLRAPVIGTICQAIQTITVDRRDPESRSKVVQEISARAAWHTLSDDEKAKLHGPSSVGRSWPRIMLFPEGTTTNGRALISFKQGAFVPRAPVQPFVITFPSRWPGGRFYPCWVSAGPSIFVMLLRLWSEPLNYCRIEQLDVVSPTAEESEPATDPIVYARRVRAIMAARMNVPVTEHSYEDVVLQDAALNMDRKKKKRRLSAEAAAAAVRDGPGLMLPHSNVGDPTLTRVLSVPATPATPAAPLLTAGIEVGELKRLFGSSLDQIQAHLTRFQRMDTRKDGRVDYDEFLTFFEIDKQKDREDGQRSSMRHLFQLLDEDESGSLDFREFLCGLALLSDPMVEDPKTSGEGHNNSSGSGDGASSSSGPASPDQMSERMLTFAFRMFDFDEDGLVELSDLKRVFRRAFPDVSEGGVNEAFADVALRAKEKEGANADGPLCTPGGSDRVGVTYADFVHFCHTHPSCVKKFEETIFFKK